MKNHIETHSHICELSVLWPNGFWWQAIFTLHLKWLVSHLNSSIALLSTLLLTHTRKYLPECIAPWSSSYKPSFDRQITHSRYAIYNICMLTTYIHEKIEQWNVTISLNVKRQADDLHHQMALAFDHKIWFTIQVGRITAWNTIGTGWRGYWGPLNVYKIRAGSG